MLVRIMSDLHAEGYFFRYEHKNEDVLVLNGDIHTQNRLHNILDQIPSDVIVLFVAGNHEYYGTMPKNEVDAYFKTLTERPNFVWLNNTSISLHDDQGEISFFGGTMWTNFGNVNASEVYHAKLAASDGINDFRFIRVLDGKTLRLWTPDDCVKEFQKFRSAFSTWDLTAGDVRRCVITHFSPSISCIDQRFNTPANRMLNAYFQANCDDMLGFDGTWIFGHTHQRGQFKLGDTNIYTNARGYRNEIGPNYPDMILTL